MASPVDTQDAGDFETIELVSHLELPRARQRRKLGRRSRHIDEVAN